MADTFHQIFLHIVFAVKFRKSIIHPDWEVELYRYTTGVIQNKGHKLLAIGGMPDHVHIFIGLRPSEALSDLVREIKKTTTAFIREKKFCIEQFQWQEGYGAFSHSRSQISRVCHYIENQKGHHQKTSFREEYNKILKDLQIETQGKKNFNLIDEGVQPEY